jgi:hypothetical protein
MLHRVALVRTGMRLLLVTANVEEWRENHKSYIAKVVPSSPILVTLIMEARLSSEMVVLIRGTRRNVPGEGILYLVGSWRNYKATCKIWGFHGGDYEEWCLLGCYAVWLL